jgi:hypothetical protein
MMCDARESFPLKIEVNVQKIMQKSVPVELPIYKQIEISIDVQIDLNNAKPSEGDHFISEKKVCGISNN